MKTKLLFRDIPNWPTKAKSCLNCVHANYEENGEEVEVLVCFLRRKRIGKFDQAAECVNYYTGSYE